jgi:hypothetical protein
MGSRTSRTIAATITVVAGVLGALCGGAVSHVIALFVGYIEPETLFRMNWIIGGGAIVAAMATLATVAFVPDAIAWNRIVYGAAIGAASGIMWDIVVIAEVATRTRTAFIASAMIAMGVALGIVAQLRRRGVEEADGCCSRCGYCLTGIEHTTRCPECGALYRRER